MKALTILLVLYVLPAATQPGCKRPQKGGWEREHQSEKLNLEWQRYWECLHGIKHGERK